MGGRGSWSKTHGGIVGSAGGAGSLYVSGQVETREDIRQLFINELGFTELYGTNAVDTAQLAALGIQLKKLEKQDGVLANNKVYLTITNQEGVKGAAALAKDGSMIMFVNPKLHNSVSGFRQTLKSEQKSGFKTLTDGKITNDFSYTARHEFGHLVQYDHMKTTGKSAKTMRSEIQNIAKTRYNNSQKHPSKYGSTNEYEFFAEGYASMSGGKPSVLGKATSDWLSVNGRRKNKR